MPVDVTHSSHPLVQLHPAAGASVLQRLRLGWPCRSDALFAFGVSLVWLVFDNQRFWSEAAQAMWHGSPSSVLFLGSLFVLVWSLQALLLLILPSRKLMVGAASLYFVVAAAGSYFAAKYGVVMNRDMLRNVFETDSAESRSLMTADLWLRVVVLGVIPAVIAWHARFPQLRWQQGLKWRFFAIAGSLAACAVALISCSASYAVFFREHKPVRYLLMPAAPVTSAIGVAVEMNKTRQGPLINAGGVAHRAGPVHARPLVLVLVVGETARADNFQLGGYARATNPEIGATQGVVYFPNTTSCGTATAISVPCMFSHLPRETFNVNEASGYTNVLDALHQAGLQVEWRDNNAGCKGVCARVETIQYRPDANPTLCPESYCYDEVMLTDLEQKLASIQTDSVIVMHQIGSHGPAYSERYPQRFERFKPACHSNQLQNCTPQEVVNAYDNTIAYTDHVLARTIELLRKADQVDTALLYVSDHGESLGEKGLYLHGLPYSFAPGSQKHVPMLMWLSPSYEARQHIGHGCLAQRSQGAFSHDNLYHTMLGAAEVRNASYDPALDVLADCRTALPDDHV